MTLAERQDELKHRQAADGHPQPVNGLEPLLTPEDIANLWKCDSSSVRRIFTREPGVVNVGTGLKHKTIRIPRTVYDRVMRRREVA